MNINEIVYDLAKQMNISLASIARAIHQSPQNFSNKLSRGTLSLKELGEIAEAFNLDFSISYGIEGNNKLLFRRNSIVNVDILEFVVFCIEKLKDDMKISGVDAYKTLTEKTNILYPYIVKNYEVLHTQGEQYIVNDLKEVMERKMSYQQ